jgi:hypothetical protein
MFHGLLQESYTIESACNCSAVLCCAVLLQLGTGSLSYLLTWQGSQPQLDPVLFVAHTDVVPVDESTLKVSKGCEHVLHQALSNGKRQSGGGVANVLRTHAA